MQRPTTTGAWMCGGKGMALKRTEPTMDTYWSVSYSPRAPQGEPRMEQLLRCDDEASARASAKQLSLLHGHANVSNFAGHVASYCNGQLWQSSVGRD